MNFTRIPYTKERRRKDEEHLKDVEFFNKNSQEIMKQYPEQWIGILGQKVVGAAPDIYDLMAQLKEKGIAQDVVLWQHMTKEETLMLDVYDPDIDEWQLVITTIRMHND